MFLKLTPTQMLDNRPAQLTHTLRTIPQIDQKQSQRMPNSTNF